MTTDLETQLRDYWTTVSDMLPDLDADQLRDRPRPVDPHPSPSRWRPLAVAGAAAVIVLAVFGGVALLFGGESAETANQPPPGSDLLLDYPISKIPPFRADIRYTVDPEATPSVPKEFVTVTVSFDGPDRFRVDVNENVPHFEGNRFDPETGEPAPRDPVPSSWAANAGSFTVRNGDEVGEYVAGEVGEDLPGDGLFVYRDLPTGFAGVEPLAWATWDDLCTFGDREFLSSDPVAGREVLRLRCTGPTASYDLSVDVETGLLLRVEGGELPMPSLPVWLPAIGFEVATIEYDPPFAAGHFEVVAPEWSEIDDLRGVGIDAGVAGPLEGRPAPALRGTTLDGAPFDLADLLGTRVALYFWASWCDRTCLDPFPSLEAAAAEYPSVAFVMVPFRDPPEAARGVLEEQGIDFLAVISAELNAETQPSGGPWNVQGVPYLVLVDRDGTVAATHLGFGPTDDYRGVLQDAGW